MRTGFRTRCEFRSQTDSGALIVIDSFERGHLNIQSIACTRDSRGFRNPALFLRDWYLFVIDNIIYAHTLNRVVEIFLDLIIDRETNSAPPSA